MVRLFTITVSNRPTQTTRMSAGNEDSISPASEAFELQRRGAPKTLSPSIKNNNHQPHRCPPEPPSVTEPSSDLPSRKKKRRLCAPSNNPKSSSHRITRSSPTCPICGDKKPEVEFFRSSGCGGHSYCSECMSKYVSVKMQDNVFSVKCPDPDCESVLDPQICLEMVPKEVLDLWEAALCESLIPAAQKFYCPFEDCSVLMVDDCGEETTFAKCFSCRRQFCAKCRVVWHAGVDCSEFQRVKDQGETERKNEKLVSELAESKRWKRCPNCQFYVEKSQGCMHISCRCRFQFCYSCGSVWDYAHACMPR